MKTQVLPRVFNLSPSVRFPAAWHLLARIDGDGVESATFENATGVLVYRERIAVQRVDEPAGACAPASDAPGIVKATPL